LKAVRGTLIKNKIAIEKMRTAGKRLACILQDIGPEVVAGISTLDLDRIVEDKMRKSGLVPECKGYAGYKHATCISLNDGIVHGIPSKDLILKSGDFVKIDVVGSYKSYCADMTRFFFVGDVSIVTRKIAQTAQDALDAAIGKIAPGVRVSEISACIQDKVEFDGFSIIRAFAGHGIGKDLHEDPDIPNYRKAGDDVVLREGMTLAIEPMISERSHEVRILQDGWTAKTADGGLAAHVEDTVLVVKNGSEVLTRI
jgi:methionyl aminopeptidase